MISGFLIGFIRLYRYLLSPWIGRNCRFTPSCSAYAIEAIQTKGALRGTLLAMWRILRCNPWCKGGHDPVPGTCHHASGEHVSDPHDGHQGNTQNAKLR